VNFLEIHEAAQRYTVPLPFTGTIGADGSVKIPMSASPVRETRATAVRAQGGDLSAREREVLDLLIRRTARFGLTRAQIEAELGPGARDVIKRLSRRNLVCQSSGRTPRWLATPAGFAAWNTTPENP
jgi:hypothetical protein